MYDVRIPGKITYSFNRFGCDIIYTDVVENGNTMVKDARCMESHVRPMASPIHAIQKSQNKRNRKQ